MYVYSSRVNTYDNPSPIFRQRGELSGSTPTSLKSTCATPLAHPSLCSARCLVHPAAPSLFAGNYIDRWFSSSLGNIGERRPRCSSVLSNPPRPAVSICYFYIILPPPFSLSVDHHHPPPRLGIFSFRASFSLSLSLFFSVSILPSQSAHPCALSFSVFPFAVASSCPRRFSNALSFSFVLSRSLFHSDPDKSE